MNYTEELLKYAFENGTLTVDTVKNNIIYMERKKYLQKHTYKIWKGNDEKWYTYLPDDEKGRVLKKRNSKKEIEDIIIRFYKEAEMTIDSLFYEWVDRKLEYGEVSKGTHTRYVEVYKRYFTDFGKRKVSTITECDIEDFIKSTIHENNLTSKAYSNMRILVYGIFKLAKKKGYISFSITNTIHDMEISRKLFKKVVRDDEHEVFSEKEMPMMISYLEDNIDMVNLGLLLLFKTGMRVGELVALTWDDINMKECTVTVNKTETRYSENNDGKYVYAVKDTPKTEAGNRDIIIPKDSIWILKELRKINPFTEYIFERNGHRIHTYDVRARLRSICKRKLHIVSKTPHKIRKTYGTILVDNNIPDTFIIEQMGHTDISCTKKYYYKNRKSFEQKKEMIDNLKAL